MEIENIINRILFFQITDIQNHSFTGMDYGPILEPNIPATTASAPPAGDYDKYEMLWWAQLAWTTAFSLMLIVAIGGNIIVIWIVTGQFIKSFFKNYISPRIVIVFFIYYFHNCGTYICYLNSKNISLTY